MSACGMEASGLVRDPLVRVCSWPFPWSVTGCVFVAFSVTSHCACVSGLASDLSLGVCPWPCP